MNLEKHDLLILDGACGTSIQEMNLPDSTWRGYDGCNEYLNISAPELIVEIHSSFLDAGAMILESNTFGATRTVLAEYGLEDRVEEINRSAVENARKAVGGRENSYVAGSLGPTTKLPSLGHITPGEMYAAFREQVQVLLRTGVDLLLIETCQDLLQARTAILACRKLMEEQDVQVPLMVSITLERTGTMLVGTDIAAAAVTLEPFGLFSLGLNCATGPAEMESAISYLSGNWPGRISCIPNQGLPEVVDGKTCYQLTPEDYAKQMRRFVEEFGVSIVGGCCGTTPTHLRALVKELRGVKPGVREVTS